MGNNRKDMHRSNKGGFEAKISHQLVVAYLENTLSDADKAQIMKVRRDHPEHSLLFELVELYKDEALNQMDTVGEEHLITSFSEIDKLLIKILSGSPQPSDIQNFIYGLRASHLFYHRSMVKLKTITREYVMEDIAEMAQIKMKTDDEVLSKVLEATGVKKPLPAKKQLLETPKVKIPSIFDFVARIPKPAYAIPLIAVILIFVLPQILKRIQPDITLVHTYDNEVPYDPDSGSLRTGTEEFPNDPQFQTKITHFELGMSHYLAWDYQNAIIVFQSLKSTVDSLKSQSLQPQHIAFLRDFYFYSGVSHLALFTSQSLALEEQVKKQHLDEAIVYLLEAYSLVENHDLTEADREYYFLGLAYGLSEQTQNAIELLRKIELHSQFNEDSQKIIQKWSN